MSAVILMSALFSFWSIGVFAVLARSRTLTQVLVRSAGSVVAAGCSAAVVRFAVTCVGSCVGLALEAGELLSLQPKARPQSIPNMRSFIRRSLLKTLKNKKPTWGNTVKRSLRRLTPEQASRPTRTGQAALYLVIRRLQDGANYPLLSCRDGVGKRRAKVRIRKDFMNPSQKWAFAARRVP